MKKTISFIIFGLITCIFLISCENQKTTQEYIREEKRAIERFINSKGIKVLNNYPENHKFGEKEFYRTKEGLYFQVIDSGNGKKVKPLVDRVQVRFDYMLYIKSYVTGNRDSIVPPENILPMQFTYGVIGSYGQPDPLTNLSCNGWAIPLEYVSEGAIVNLIIPSSLGTENANLNFIPYYYENLKYTKFY